MHFLVLASSAGMQVSVDNPAVAVHPYSASYSKTAIATILTAGGGGASLAGHSVVVGGWVKSGREQGGGTFAFVQLNDGSIFTDLQVRRPSQNALTVGGTCLPHPVHTISSCGVRSARCRRQVTTCTQSPPTAAGTGKHQAGSVQVYLPREVASDHGLKGVTKTGASLLVRGTLAATPPEVAQDVELKAEAILHYGPCDPKAYPMAKKKHGMEFLREKAHLRPRTNVIGAVARVRNQLAFATHAFFQQHGFQYVHTPIITASDCEGAGEMFQARPTLPFSEDRFPPALPVAFTEADQASNSG